MLQNFISHGVLAFTLLALTASAQYIIESLSFGHDGHLSPNLRAIPGWHLTGEGHTPQILSDRIILTPPAPGSTRGSLWTETGATQGAWTAEVSFRASGQERGSGNLQIWYAKDGQTTVGSNSVYTVPNFDGLVLNIDQYGSRGGMLRGFLNDGSTSFKDHHNVDSMAFGHCDFAYRNLGRPSRVRLTNDVDGFKVEIDDRECFSSDKVQLPAGYQFGISAATSENPDSFEVNHFVVSTTKSITREEPNTANKQPPSGGTNSLPSSPEQLPDMDATSIKRQEEQFADLHNRLQSLSHQINNVFGEFERISNTMNDRHAELIGKIPRSSDEALSSLSRRVESIERTVQTIQRDVEGRDYKEHLSNLQQAVEGVRGGLADSLPDRLSQSEYFPITALS